MPPTKTEPAAAVFRKGEKKNRSAWSGSEGFVCAQLVRVKGDEPEKCLEPLSTSECPNPK